MRLLLLLSLLPALAFGQGIPLKSGAGSDLATVNSAKSLYVVRGASTLATYSCTMTALVSRRRSTRCSSTRRRGVASRCRKSACRRTRQRRPPQLSR